MPSKLLVTCTAIALAALGLTFLFAPAEGLAALAPGGTTAPEPTSASLLIAQLYAATLLGLAGFNYLSRREIARGNPSCTLAQTNFMHFAAGALVLVKPALRAPGLPLLGGLALYAVFALLYAWVLWGPKRA